MANSHHSREKYIQIANKLRGQKRTQATKDKISKALIGRKLNPETIAKMSKPRSEQGKLNISKARMGKSPWNKGLKGIYSQQTIQKLRDANLGKKHSLESREKQRLSLIKHFKRLNPNYVEPVYESNEKNRKHQQTRMNRLRANGGSHTRTQWSHLKLAHDNRCLMCKRQEPEIRLTKDHIISIKNGGNDDIANIQPLCGSCNSKKR